jgi:hypothetical protein
MLKTRIAALGMAGAITVTGAAATGCTYNPLQGLRHRAAAACSGYWYLWTNGYQYGDPRFHARWVWINTDRRPTC